MARSAKHGLLATALAFLAAFSLGTLAARAATPPPKTNTKSPADTARALTPQEQTAQSLLERVKAEIEVREKERRFLAAQYAQAGKDKLEMGDFKGALRDFVKGADYDPDNRDARDGLKRARSILGIQQGVPGAILEGYANERSVALAHARLELVNHYIEAKTLYEKGRYPEAVEAFRRVESEAKYLSPLLDVGPVTGDAAGYILKATTGMEEQRLREQKDRALKAKSEGSRLRDDREQGTKDRSKALAEQAASLIEQRRYEEARKAAEALLRVDPGNSAAQRIYETAAASARDQAIDSTLRKREAETGRHMQELAAMMVPQGSLVYMPPGISEAVRNRKAEPLYSEERKGSPEWEAKVRETLAKKVSFDFVETPLADVLSFLSSLADTTIVLDKAAVKEHEPQISLRVNDMRLESALGWICRLAGLGYGLKDEAIFVSAPGSLRETPRLRLYDVTDLTIDIKNFAGNQRALATDSGHGAGQQGGNLGQEFFRGDKDEEKSERMTPKALVEFIRKLVTPGRWIEEELGIPAHEGQGERDKDKVTGQGLADVISITVGGRTWVGIKDKE